MKIDNLTLSYWNKPVLKEINLDIEPGEFIFFIWKSGSWKTSLISSLIGDFKPSQWNIVLNNWALLYWDNYSEHILFYRRSIWIIFQDYKLLKLKTVYENVAFAMEVCWYNDYIISKRVVEVLWQVELLSKKDRFISELSGWEKQRLSIARALVHDPDIIIWDEPTWNLDPETALEIMKIFEELNNQWKTVLIATHDDHIVNTFSKRVVSFEKNKVKTDNKKGTFNL